MWKPYEYIPNQPPEQTPNATDPRIVMNNAIPPRVPASTQMIDTTEFIYPKRDTCNEQKEKSGKPTSPKLQTGSPRWSPQIEALKKDSTCRCREPLQRQHPSPKCKKQINTGTAQWNTVWSEDNQIRTIPGVHPNLHWGHAQTSQTI